MVPLLSLLKREDLGLGEVVHCACKLVVCKCQVELNERRLQRLPGC